MNTPSKIFYERINFSYRTKTCGEQVSFISRALPACIVFAFLGVAATIAAYFWVAFVLWFGHCSDITLSPHSMSFADCTCPKHLETTKVMTNTI